MKYLIKEGLNANLKTQSGHTPFEYARKEKHFEIAQILLPWNNSRTISSSSSTGLVITKHANLIDFYKKAILHFFY